MAKWCAALRLHPEKHWPNEALVPIRSLGVSFSNAESGEERVEDLLHVGMADHFADCLQGPAEVDRDELRREIFASRRISRLVAGRERAAQTIAVARD